MHKTACIISVGTYAGHKCLFKGRDRNYVPEVRVYHELSPDGTEVLYLKDEITGWCEGLNEYGIGIVNSALAVVDDENEKDAAKGKSTKATGATLRDGERICAALGETTLDKAVETVQTFKKGLRGHTLVADTDKTVSLESTWRGHDFHQQTLSENKIHVRTNHGLFHETAGYTAKDGDNYLSTLARRDQAMKVLRGVENHTQVAPAIYGHRKPDRKDPLNMVKLTDNMRTTTQMVLDLTDKTAYLYLIPGQVKYLGYKIDPKITEPKIKFKLYEYTDIDGDGEFDVLERKPAKIDKTASLEQAWGPATTQKQAGFLPLMDPLFNLREIAKQMILLEDHLFHEQKQCVDCLRKHLLQIEALAEEAVTLDNPTGEHKQLCQKLAELARETSEQLFSGETKPEKVAQDIRVIRKQLVDMTSKLKVTASSDTPAVDLESLWAAQNIRLAKFKSKKKIKTQDGKDTITVYEYSDRQVANRNKEKAERLEALTKNISKLESQVSKDMDSKDTKTRLTALAVGLLRATYERVGNEGSADDGHFGVTGWLKEHLKFSGSKATISYTGKSGVEHTKTVDDSKLVKALKGCCEDKKPDQSILSFGEDDTEGAVKITAADVNEYLKPFDISAKDIRGYSANEVMKTELKAERKKGGKLPEDKKERDQKLKDEFKAALERTAEAVGHQPSMCRKSYLVPDLEPTYLKDGTIMESMVKKGSLSYTNERDACPVCNQKATGSCRCSIGDRTCPNGHEWIVCPIDGNHIVIPDGVDTHGRGIQPNTCLCDKFSQQIKTASVCDPKGTSYAWVDPTGKVYKLHGSMTHDTFAEQYAKENNWPSFHDQILSAKFITLIGEGWIRVTNAYNIEANKIGVPAPAWEQVAQMLVDCGGSPDARVYVQVTQGSNPVFTAGDFVRKFGGHQMVDQMYSKLKTANRTAALEALYGHCLFSVTATLSQGEKEDRAVDNLIKPSPDKKPPRDDLRNHRVDTDTDPDLNPKQDKDLSKNYKDT